MTIFLQLKQYYEKSYHGFNFIIGQTFEPFKICVLVVSDEGRFLWNFVWKVCCFSWDWIEIIQNILNKTNISYPLIRKCTCAYQQVRNVIFSGNFAYVLNEWSHFNFIIHVMINGLAFGDNCGLEHLHQPKLLWEK